MSPERDVSLSSGSLIANALREAGHRVLLIDVYEGLSIDECDYERAFQTKEKGTPLKRLSKMRPGWSPIY